MSVIVELSAGASGCLISVCFRCDDVSSTVSGESEVLQVRSSRDPTEHIEKTTHRLSLAIQKRLHPPTKRRKKGPGPATPPELPSIKFEGSDGVEIDLQVPLGEALEVARYLIIDNVKLTIVINGPTLRKISLMHPRANCICAPVVIGDRCRSEDVILSWRWAGGQASDIFHQGEFFKFNLEHVGKLLLVRAHHKDYPCHYIETNQALPIREMIGELSPMHLGRLERFQVAKEADELAFSVLSYNILADCYARTPRAMDISYPYCPKEAVDWSYRRGLLIEELRASKTDIIGLQECAVSAATGFLKSFAREKGYNWAFKAKLGRVREGEMLLFKKNRFHCVKDFSISFKDLVADFASPEVISTYHRLFPFFFEKDLSHLTTIFQILLLRDRFDGDKPLLVCNTHLFFHPRAAHTRLLQVHLLNSYLHHLSEKALSIKEITQPIERQIELVHHIDLSEEPRPSHRLQIRSADRAAPIIPVIMIGDLNSTTDSLAAQYLHHGASPTVPEWSNYQCTHTFVEDAGEEEGEAATDGLPESISPRITGLPSSIIPSSDHIADERNCSLREALTYSVPIKLPEIPSVQITRMNNPFKGKMCSDVYAAHQAQLLPVNEHLKWTNRVTGFCEQLDYIGATDGFRVTGLLGCPQSCDDLDCPDVLGLPNVMYPSDHIAIGAVFRRSDPN